MSLFYGGRATFVEPANPKPEEGLKKCRPPANPETTCPFCNTKYHRIESPFLGKKEIWEDCLKCNKTKSRIITEYVQTMG